MLFSIKKRDDLEKKQVSINTKPNQSFGIKDKLGKQNYHEVVKKVFEPFTKSNKDDPENITKTITKESKKKDKAIADLNNKLSDIMIDWSISASYFLSLLFEITNRKETSQYQPVMDPDSNGVKDLFLKSTC